MGQEFGGRHPCCQEICGKIGKFVSDSQDVFPSLSSTSCCQGCVKGQNLSHEYPAPTSSDSSLELSLKLCSIVFVLYK